MSYKSNRQKNTYLTYSSYDLIPEPCTGAISSDNLSQNDRLSRRLRRDAVHPCSSPHITDDPIGVSECVPLGTHDDLAPEQGSGVISPHIADDEQNIPSNKDEIINDILTDISNEVDKNSEPIIKEIISEYKLNNSIDEIIGGMTINDNNDIYEKYTQIYKYDIHDNNKIILFLLIILLIILLYIIYKFSNKKSNNIDKN